MSRPWANVLFLSLLIFSLLILSACLTNSDDARESPVITALYASDTITVPNDTVTIICEATDEGRPTEAIDWGISGGNFVNGNGGSVLIWRAPEELGRYRISAYPYDNYSHTSDSIFIEVVDSIATLITD